MSYQIMSGEVAVPTAAEDATMFTPNNPDSTPNIRLVITQQQMQKYTILIQRGWRLAV